MRLVNLTPVPLTIAGVLQDVTIPPHGVVARVSPVFAGDQMILVDGATIFVRAQNLDNISGLPDPQDGTLYIVTCDVACAVAGERNDVVTPGPVVRGDRSHPVVHDGLIRIRRGS